ncbi:MAG: tripartite tricarboxylate transporter substrate-binding protein, partial [Gammaproteobacteria bacterium]
MTRLITRRPVLSLLAASAALPFAARADSRPIRLVVPYAAGGPIDVTARALAERAKDAFGGPIIIDNKPGAGGNIGADMVAKAQPDGLTIG